jgi:bifunctional non-homologous end joining protein LigD
MGKLEEYRRKRKFDRTPEPAGAPDVDEAQNGEAAIGVSQRAVVPTAAGKPATAIKRTPAPVGPPRRAGTRLPKPMPKLRLQPRGDAGHGNIFVVQKHSATRLHYDFRLAIDGTLKSWAVPKGPSQSQADKRLAVQTEDHPLEYGGFEGKIPEGNYGAGTVMVWDRGTFVVDGDPGKPQVGVLDALQQLERGEIKFILNGEKLRGSFVLVKIKRSEKGNEWLMIKKHDDHVVEGYDAGDIDESVLSKRSMDDIAGDARSREWKSDRPATRGKLKAAWLADAIARVEKKKAAQGARGTQKKKASSKKKA